MVSESEHRGSHHFSAGILRVAGGQKVVGTVLQTALARLIYLLMIILPILPTCLPTRHHRHLSEGSGAGQAGPQEDHRPASQADSHEVNFSHSHWSPSLQILGSDWLKSTH